VFGFPSPVGVMEFGTFTVAAVDNFGNVITGYRGSVDLFSDDALLDSLPYTFTADDAGVHVFNAVFQTAGTHYIRAVDHVLPNLFGEQDGIVVV
jgi:hypothetical protein